MAAAAKKETISVQYSIVEVTAKIYPARAVMNRTVFLSQGLTVMMKVSSAIASPIPVPILISRLV